MKSSKLPLYAMYQAICSFILNVQTPLARFICETRTPGGSLGKESTCNAGDLGLIPGSGRILGVEQGNPLQYSCLKNLMDKEAWQATVYRVTKSWTQLKILGEANGNRLQCSCLENPTERGAWWAAVYGVAQSRTRLKRLSSSSSSRRYLALRHVYETTDVF